MRIIILAVLLSSCSMIHKTSSKQFKDSTAVITDNSSQYKKTDSTYTSKNKEIETADLVVVFKDSTTGFVFLSGDSISIPASAIKEIRHKRVKQKQSDQTKRVVSEQAILTDTKQIVTVKQKTVTKDKKVLKFSWIWFFVIIASIVLYTYRKKIYEIYKAFTI